MASKGSPFELGLSLGAASGGAVLLLVYTVAVPTHDLRARLPFLMSSPSPGLLVALLGAFGLPALLVLAISRRTAPASYAGVLVSSLGCLLMLGSGLTGDLLPDFTSMTWRALITVALCTLSGLSIARALKRDRALAPKGPASSGAAE
jgi:hypothetical protein